MQAWDPALKKHTVKFNLVNCVNFKNVGSAGEDGLTLRVGTTCTWNWVPRSVVGLEYSLWGLGEYDLN